MIGVLHGFAIIFFIIAVGYALARTQVIKASERLVLNRVSFYAATPALVFTVVAQSRPEELFSPVIAVTTLASLVTAVIFVAASRAWFPADRASTVFGAAASSYVNSNNIGLPVGIYVLGSAAYVAPLLVVQMVVLTPLILALSQEPAQAKAGRSRALQMLATIGKSIVNPIVLGSFAGFAVCITQAQVPSIIMEPITLLGGASIPVILMSFGASLHAASPLSDAAQRTAAITATGLKTAGMPLVAFLIGWLFGLSGAELYAAVILSALPTAQNIYNYAATYQRGEVVARDSILLSTFLALPAMLVIALAFGA